MRYMPNNKKGGKGGKVVSFTKHAGPNAFQRLKQLRCFTEMRKRLIDGWGLAEVARFIQQDNKEYVDISKESLTAILHKFRATIPAMEMAKKGLPVSTLEAAREVVEALDEIKALHDLYKIQMERVEIDRKTEKAINKLLPSMTQEIRVAKELLESSAKLKLDKGIDEKHLGTITHEHEGAIIHAEASNPAVQKVLENAQSRMKVLGVAQRLFATAGVVSERPVIAAEAIKELPPVETPPTLSPEEDAALDEELRETLEAEFEDVATEAMAHDVLDEEEAVEGEDE
jgi:hypothetical protein